MPGFRVCEVRLGGGGSGFLVRREILWREGKKMKKMKKRRGGWEHTVAAHGDAVRYTDGVELPGQHVLRLDSLLDQLAQVHHWWTIVS